MPEEWRYGHLGYDAALSEEWADDVRALKPWLLEQLQRIMVWRHMHHTVIEEDASDSIQVGLHYAEAVYAPLYYGYGRDSFSDRRRRARQWDRALLEFAPETILVLLRASPEAIRERMRAAPRPDGVPREEDIGKVIDLFEEQYASTELTQKLAHPHERRNGGGVGRRVCEQGRAVPHRRRPPSAGVGSGPRPRAGEPGWTGVSPKIDATCCFLWGPHSWRLRFDQQACHTFATETRQNRDVPATTLQQGIAHAGGGRGSCKRHHPA